MKRPGIPTQCTPVYLDHIKAKSADAEGRQQTLAEHTWAVVAGIADMQRLHSNLPASAERKRVWLRQYYTGFLHDFGKAAEEFQLRLSGSKAETTWLNGRHRHEVLSLGYVQWIFPPGHTDRIPVLLSIATHHKDMHEILLKYGARSRTREQSARLQWLAEQSGEANQRLLWQWLHDYRCAWFQELEFQFEDDTVVQPFAMVSAEQIEKALDECSNYLLRYQDVVVDSTFLVRDLLNRGLILTADHAGSAGTEAFPDMPLTTTVARRPLGKHPLRDHQAAAAETPLGSAILIAPTGSGKTEAAMLWAARQMEHQPAARLFYTLPYQASMNAMRDRLAIEFFGIDPAAVRRGESRTVAIQHSRALLKHFQDYMSLDESSPAAARRTAKQLHNLAQLNFYPIQVFSPYQMLKAAYRLKGYETLLLDYTGALFVFDEIHAYEPKRLALIITFIRWLRDLFNARFLVMTATLPPPVLAKLKLALGIGSTNMIEATAEDFQRAQRHVVRILQGRLEDAIVECVRENYAAGQSVLVCLNRVSDAQNVYRLLKRELNLLSDVVDTDANGADVVCAQEVDVHDVDIVLLHSRFNGKDRARKEEILKQRARVGRPNTERRPFVCVATQVVEVSLNVDFDTIYTAPAPLEALLQRFGRVNRGRQSVNGSPIPLCPVHVFRLPSDPAGKRPHLPYDEAMVAASLRVLEARCGERPIDESIVSAMLGEIYQGEIAAGWESDYQRSAEEFATAILDAVEPCESADLATYQQFFEMFDGVEVLPEDCSDEYYRERDAGGYLAASSYLVNISHKQYGEFRGYGLVASARDQEGEYADHINVAYSREFGLDLEEARQDYRRQRQMKEDDPGGSIP